MANNTEKRGTDGSPVDAMGMRERALAATRARLATDRRLAAVEAQLWKAADEMADRGLMSASVHFDPPELRLDDARALVNLFESRGFNANIGEVYAGAFRIYLSW